MLAEQLWPKKDTDATRSRLRTALWALRRILEPDETPAGNVLTTDRSGLGLASGAVVTDVSEFEEALRAATRSREPEHRVASYCRAVELYTGELLPGCYEEWIAPERARLGEAWQRALGDAAVALAESGELPRAIEYARRAVSADPLQESSRRALIRPPHALRPFRGCCQTVPRS